MFLLIEVWWMNEDLLCITFYEIRWINFPFNFYAHSVVPNWFLDWTPTLLLRINGAEKYYDTKT